MAQVNSADHVVESGGRELASSHATLQVVTRCRSLFWRIHFWAALIATPFALMAAGTGILYIFTPQIEQTLYGSLEHVVPSGNRRSLNELVAAATNVVPNDVSVELVTPPYAEDDVVKVDFSLASQHAMQAGHEGHEQQKIASKARPPAVEDTTVYVNPYSAMVIGVLPEAQRFSAWAKKLHSSLLQGEGWRWMIELGASWLLVMLLTGIYLWWPHGAQRALPQTGAKGRAAWKQWHSFAGVALSALTFAMLATGVTWSKYAGTQVRQLRDVAGQAPPSVPRDLVSMPTVGAALLSYQAIWDAARARSPDVRMQLVPPKNEQGVWRISNADKTQPMKKFDLVLDAYTGQTLYYAAWDKQTAFSKATALGIPFHRGELGVWNQFLLMLFGLGVLFSLASGWIMFFKRRWYGGLAMPIVLPDALKSVHVVAWILAVGLFTLLPLLAISTVLVLLVEFYWWWSRPRSKLFSANASR